MKGSLQYGFSENSPKFSWKIFVISVIAAIFLERDSTKATALVILPKNLSLHKILLLTHLFSGGRERVYWKRNGLTFPCYSLFLLMLKESHVVIQIGHKVGKLLSSNTNKSWYANVVSNQFKRFLITINYKFKNLYEHLNLLAKLATLNR